MTNDESPIRVMLVDDDELIRVGFRMILEAQPDTEVAGEAADGDTAVEAARDTPVDVVLMDVRMPRLSGVEATRAICAAPGSPRVLVLTTFDLDEYAYEALNAGASGFLLKNTQPGDLVSAIRAVNAGDAVVAPSTTRRLLDRYAGRLTTHSVNADDHLSPLTAREREVMVLVAHGLSNGEIAARLYVSEGTVKTHVAHILAKLRLRDRVQAVVMAHRIGLVEPRH